MENTNKNLATEYPIKPYRFQKQDSQGNNYAVDLINVKSNLIQDINIITTIINSNIYSSLLNFHRDVFGSEICSDNLPSSLEYNLKYVTTNSKILSIVYRFYYYFSGAIHGLHATYCYNFILHPYLMSIDSIHELFKQDQKLLKAIIDISRTKLVEIDDYILKGMFEDSLKEWDDFENFSFAKDGIHFHFQEYQVGPYSSGCPEIVIPYETLTQFLTDNVSILLTNDDFNLIYECNR